MKAEVRFEETRMLVELKAENPADEVLLRLIAYSQPDAIGTDAKIWIELVRRS